MSDVFDFAMKMERDGKAYYEKLASQTTIPALKKILEGLAADEQRHYNIFSKLKEEHASDLGALSKKGTMIIGTTKNVFERLARKPAAIDSTKEAIEVWKHAQEIEKKSEDFYRQKAGEVKYPQGREILNKIAEEEHQHWVVLESVMQFLKRPKTWLEDAEWSNLREEY